MCRELARDCSPELELPETGGVDDEPAGRELDQLGGGRCVFALRRPLGNFADLELQIGLDRIQERTFTDSTLARHGGDSGAQQFLQTDRALGHP